MSVQPLMGSILDRFAKPYPTLEEVHFVHEHKPKPKALTHVVDVMIATCPECGGKQFALESPRYCIDCRKQLGGMSDKTLKVRWVEYEITIDPVSGAIDAPGAVEV